MFRHISLMLLLIVAAIGAGIALIPGERERWTMLVRDNHYEEALKILEADYRAGDRNPADVLQYYKLLMLDTQIATATQVVEQFAASRPSDIEALTLLEKHYNDTQDRQGQMQTLESMFALAPTHKTAETLLANYRLQGAFDREEKMLQALLKDQSIQAEDAERLGLMRFARADLRGAHEALAYFDKVAPMGQMTGRFALFDLLVREGDTPAAFSKAADWIRDLQQADYQLAGDPDGPVVQLVERMKATDQIAARRDFCKLAQGDAQLAAHGPLLGVECAVPVSEILTAEIPVDLTTYPIARPAGKQVATQMRARNYRPLFTVDSPGISAGRKK